MSPHMCSCGRRMNAASLHGLSYKVSTGRHQTHATLKIIKRDTELQSFYFGTVES